MRDSLRVWLFVLLVVAVVGLATYAEVSVWQECRRDHSWLYCMSLISR
jgi:hypothetical protein